MLFGTDGIRGKVCLESCSDPVDALVNERKITPDLLWLVGHVLSMKVEKHSRVIIGWDNRPDNPVLVQALANALDDEEIEVILAGICATPALHGATLLNQCEFGCMITASHNPVQDSGIKIFNKNGLKTSPEQELEISRLAHDLWQEEIGELIPNTYKPLSAYEKFDADGFHQQEIETLLQTSEIKHHLQISRPLFIDSSKGAAASWLAKHLTNSGIEAVEVSKKAKALNENCGAGELSPGQRWSLDDAKKEAHLLIKSISTTHDSSILPPKSLVGMALDGDGDRCLGVITHESGYEVIDGDLMGYLITRNMASKSTLAASIESDLALKHHIQNLHRENEVIQTAVGDRWLSYALMEAYSQNSDQETSKILPLLIGIEDSGHLVMPRKHPLIEGQWCLVGDGVRCMIRLLQVIVNGFFKEFPSTGFKNRISIKPFNRKLWNGENELSRNIEKLIQSNHPSAKRTYIDGENNLLLMQAEGFSIGIRNSGTEEKISISLRLRERESNEIFLTTLEKIKQILSEQMSRID
mgnify:FL=1